MDLVAYADVGSNNADLPEEAVILNSPPPDMAAFLPSNGRATTFSRVFAATQLFLAPTEFSTTAPLKVAAKSHGFRAATMPGFSPAMVPALPASAAQIENTLAHLVLHPSGRWLYASNRGHDSLAVFNVAADGKLSPAGHVPSGGRTPRSFALTLDGHWLIALNQDSDSLALFAIDPATGMPVDTGSRVEVPTPVSVVVD